MPAQGTEVLINFESVYESLNTLKLAAQAFSDVADDWGEEDCKYALVNLLSVNLQQQLESHQQAVFNSLNIVESKAA
ncbi:hypothetical protein [Shewanella gelidii]|uniref:Uncharacterized protein n=1 Tax=Shewanella gelidii TaxID=1642821 RepID=A0A917JZC6_9GAMM|nr:hypothetical protein [Shewanella gelidii]MCL1098079.1 hypothetical protein [Shewanella gelidii]MCL1098086.1 hypothetical protein [Shewanella gelidii]GGI93584.1 hypothetical protein GCM10009332_33530 [Shewanella gelidii]